MARNTLFRTESQKVIRISIAGAFLLLLLLGFLHYVSAPNSTMASPLVPAPQAATDLKGIVSDSLRHHLFVAGYIANSVTVFDETITPLSPITTVPVVTGPFGIGLVDDKVYVANYWKVKLRPLTIAKAVCYTPRRSQESLC